MRIYCKSNDAHGQTVYGAKVHATGVCSHCGMPLIAAGFWGRHEQNYGEASHTAWQLEDERRQHNSTAAQLRDARDLLNQVNHELAELGDENNRLRAEVSRLKSKQPRSLP